MNPVGAGAQVYVRLVRQKLQEPIRRLPNAHETKVGILTGNSASDDTEAPIAIVCEFDRAAAPSVLKELKNLAWNFCRSPLLITVEPHLVRAWSCYETPDQDPNSFFDSDPVETVSLDGGHLSQHAVTALDWIQLASGQFFVKHAARFPRDQRADKTLLANLSFVRDELTKATADSSEHIVPTDIVHDLLARLIFIQFLFDRKDSHGDAALNASVLDSLHKRKVLSKRYRGLGEILHSKSDTYALFQWLDRKFNGDLFPGKGTTPAERKAAWEREKRHVSARHLKLLAQFVGGQIEISRGQMSLWPLYSFDTIPLEFISSIYEEFVSNPKKENGEHYTPIFLVDFMLDKVLPWRGNEWDLKILDPACGSGIFLVKAFQRLAYRWRNANPGKEPDAALLRGLLERNLFGVDIDPTAVRVASFSLYLAMCDEIDPRFYWKQAKFPRLRDVTLKHADFFRDDVRGFRTVEDAGHYDLVIGNAPWGQSTLSDKAREWAADAKHRWDTSNEQSGTLFLPKAAALASSAGKICMIQPASTLLFNRSQPTIKFRSQLFRTYNVEEVVNLSAIRHDLFPNAISPACIVTLTPNSPNDLPISYWCPKRHYVGESGHRIAIDSHDHNWISPKEAAEDPWIWTALTWGGRRDHELIRRMKHDKRRRTLEANVKEKEGWHTTKGFVRQIKDVDDYQDRIGLRILEDHSLWDACPVVSDVTQFPHNANPWFARPRDLDVYQLPKLIMRLSWTVNKGRFKAVLFDSQADRDHHLLFSQSYFGVSAPDSDSLATLALVLNSSFAVYFFFLTAGSVASYRPKLLNEDIEQIPIPSESPVTMSELASMSLDQIDSHALSAYRLKSSERILIDDFFNIVLQDFKGDASSPGRQSIANGNPNRASAILAAYSTSFLKVLQAGFGNDKPVSATVFLVNSVDQPPYCLVAFHLNWPGRDPIVIERTSNPTFLERLYELDNQWQQNDPTSGSIFHHRVGRVYRTLTSATGLKIPTVYVIKPNLVRYWTRSVALQDADDVAADLLVWGSTSDLNTEQDASHA